MDSQVEYCHLSLTLPPFPSTHTQPHSITPMFGAAFSIRQIIINALYQHANAISPRWTSCVPY